MGREFELKYAATEQAQRAIAEKYGNFRTIQMETTYFDTDHRNLSAKKITLRLRRENDLTICTLKTPLADGSRGEWECEAENIREGLSSLVAMGAPAEAAQWRDRLSPVCGARFTRLAVQIPTADGTAELALDRGYLLGGGKEIPLCEVEVELKSGSDEAVLALAAELAETYGLIPENQSKFRRAMALTMGEA